MTRQGGDSARVQPRGQGREAAHGEAGAPAQAGPREPEGAGAREPEAAGARELGAAGAREPAHGQASAQRGALARPHEGAGLPRGRSRLPVETVRARQRERLLRAVIAAVASSGFGDVTVADIVRRARVSRAAFYAHFSDKQDCFLAATREGGALMFNHIRAATRKVPPGTSHEGVLRAAVTAFLEFLAAEPAFARAFYIDMPAAGPRALGRIDLALHRFADMNQAWHQRARAGNPGWPDVPPEAYVALAGATMELVRAEVRQGNTETITSLADAVVALHLAVLAARPWSNRHAG